MTCPQCGTGEFSLLGHPDEFLLERATNEMEVLVEVLRKTWTCECRDKPAQGSI